VRWEAAGLLRIIESEPDAAMAKPLIEGLSETLESITGADGRDSFADWTPDPKAVFVIALLDGEPAGCGALRPIDNETAEIKRMYARYPGGGIGRSILQYLEAFAKKAGYRRIILETRVVNERACGFYLNGGYERIENYGHYIGRHECACFEKSLS